MGIRRLLILGVVCLALAHPFTLSVGAADGSAPPAAPPAERTLPGGYDLFNFFIGKWSIRQDGAPGVANDKIKKIVGGAGVLEKYTAPNGYSGSSVTVYDIETQKWTQTWTDSDGTFIQVTGGQVGSDVVMYGTLITPAGARQYVRLTFTNIQSRSFDQNMHASTDEGQSWNLLYSTHWSK